MSDDASIQHRSFPKWVILLLTWIVGLCVWVLYVGMFFVLLYRWFS
jgi:hypothetical protein